jgi:16S rRNA (guanine966-N2)-methyltransferase
LRVIAGTARGRRLQTPAGDAVRPTKDMTREAVFSALDARGALGGAAVLDLYAGSGALGIEALSRGAEQAVFVERGRDAVEVITENLDTLGFADRARVVHADVMRFLRGPVARGAPFDLVLADPPYDTDDAAVTELVGALLGPGWLAPEVIVVVERPVRHEIEVPDAEVPDALENRWQRTFGDTLVTFLQR